MGEGSLREYVPNQHTAKPMGDNHLTTFANVKLWVDKPPDVIVLGNYRYVLEKKEQA